MAPYQFHIIIRPSHTIPTYGSDMAQTFPYHSHTFALVRAVYRVLFFQITTQKIRHLELQYCTFFTLLLYKLHELILLDFLPSCYILDNQVILPGKLFLPPTCPGTSFVKNICRTLCTFKILAP